MIKMIVAMGIKHEIGKDNELLLHHPKDLKYFKDKTMGHIVLMGRNTVESLPGELKGREIWIVSRDPEIASPGCTSVESALQTYLDLYEQRDLWICGGESIYRQAVDNLLVEELEVTIFRQDFPDANKFFPKISEDWNLVSHLDLDSTATVFSFVRA